MKTLSDPLPAPRHIALIPDGNRRWAAKLGGDAARGHDAGIRAAGPIIEAAWGAGVQVVSLWWGSPANLRKRDPSERIPEVLAEWLMRDVPGLLGRSGAQLDVLGEWEQLCPQLGPAVEYARTFQGSGPEKLVILMAYDGREELLAAARGLPEDAGLPDLRDRLWTGHLPEVDLVIRTGGEPHLSAGFLLWGIAEAILVFEPCLWPDFTPDRLAQAIRVWQHQPRRFGG